MIHISIIIFKENLVHFLKQNKTLSETNRPYYSLIMHRKVLSALHMRYFIIVLDLYNNKNKSRSQTESCFNLLTIMHFNISYKFFNPE